MFQGFAGAAAAAAPQGFFYPQVGRRKASVRGATTRWNTSPCRTELLRHKSYRAREEEKKKPACFSSFGPPTQMVSGRWSLQRVVSNVRLFLFKKCSVFTDTYLFTRGSCLLCNDLTTKVNDLFCCFCLCSRFVLGFFLNTHTQSDPSFMEELRKIIRNEVLKIFEGILCTHFAYLQQHNVPLLPWNDSFGIIFFYNSLTCNREIDIPAIDTAPPPGLKTV